MSANSASNHDGRLLFWVRHGKTFARGHAAEFLVRRDEHSRKAGSLEPERNRELQRIERAQSFDNTIIEEQSSGGAKMLAGNNRTSVRLLQFSYRSRECGLKPG